MILQQLLADHEWVEVWAALVRLYPDQEHGGPGYRAVFETLNALTPVASTMRICIEPVVDQDTGDVWHDVSGRDGTRRKEQLDLPEEYRQGEVGEQEISFGIEFTDWAEWLGMEIDPETLARYSEPEIIAHCLWEMTFFGYNQEDIRRQAEEIRRRRDDSRTYTLEELRALDWWNEEDDRSP